MTNYDAIIAIDAQIKELQRRKDALTSGYCFIPLPSYESMIDPYGLRSCDPYNLGSCPEPIACEYKAIDNSKDNI